jgi:hypothetical protein
VRESGILSEGNTHLTETRARDQAAKRKLAFSVWVFTKRAFALGAVAVTVYVTVGCVLFGAWWYELFWEDKFNWAYVAGGMKTLLDEYFPLLIGILLVVFLAFILGNFFKTHLFRFVDKFAGRIVLAALLVLVTIILVIYHTERLQHNLVRALEFSVLTMDRVQKFFLAASNSPPHIVPPVDFQYIDKSRVDELYNQIEPDLIEKERTVAKTNSAKGKVVAGVSGVATGEAEAGKTESSKSSFERATFTTERKCVDLMNYVVDNRGPKYYTNSRGWFSGRENAALAAQMEKNKTAPVDWTKLPYEKLVDDPPSEEEKREAERKAKQYQAELQNELETLSGYVFIDGEFGGTVNGDTLTLTEAFSVKPRKVVFRVNLAKSKMPEFQKQNGLRLRVFGDTIRPLSKDGYVDIRLIAAY